MKAMRWAVGAAGLLLLLAGVLISCGGLEKEEKGYQRWHKVADGYYAKEELNGWTQQGRLILRQRMGDGGIASLVEGAYYSLQLEEEPVAGVIGPLKKLGFNYNEEMDKANKAIWKEKSKELPALPAGEGRTEPAEPVGQTEPAEPAGRTEPAEPAGQTEPAEPASRTEPAESAGRTEPAEPAESGEQAGVLMVRQSYFNEKSLQIVLDLGDEVWSYDIKSGITKRLLDGTYQGKTWRQLLQEARDAWGPREHYMLSMFGPPVFSPDGQAMAYSANKDTAGTNERDGASLFLYDFDSDTEVRLAAAGDGEFYTCKGWLAPDRLLVQKDGILGDGIEQSFFLIDLEGNSFPLDLTENGIPGNVRTLKVETGKIFYTINNGGEKNRFTAAAVEVDQRGGVKPLFFCGFPDAFVYGSETLSPDGTRIAYLSKPNDYSWERNLSIKACFAEGSADRDQKQDQNKNQNQAQDQEILPVDLGEGIFTSFESGSWVDDNRLLVNIREEWAGQTTWSTWILDLRAKEDSGDPVVPKAARDDGTMAQAYMTVIDYLYNQEKGLNGKEGEIKYIALDTQDMLWLTARQKELLFEKMEAKYGVEILDKTYVRLKAEGYLQTDEDSGGYFSDGILFKITGGYFDRNVIKLEEAFKWRAGKRIYRIRDLVVEFRNEDWEIIETGSSWNS